MNDRNGTSNRLGYAPFDESDRVLLFAPWACIRLKNKRRALALVRVIGGAAARENQGLEGADLKQYRKLILKPGLIAGEVDSVDRAYWRGADSFEPRVMMLNFSIKAERARGC